MLFRSVEFDAIYSGFLAGAGQAEVVEYAYELFPGALAVVDPVMGDHGAAYKTCSPPLLRAMCGLAERADIITPNLTEACILLGRSLSDRPETHEDLNLWLESLSDGRRTVALTGLRFAPDEISTGWIDAPGGCRGVSAQPFAGRAYHGTGDIFASVLTGEIMRGQTTGDAVETAGRFVRGCAAFTFKEKTPPEDGVLFEALLGGLAR